MQLLELWQLSAQQKAALLGLESANHRSLADYRKGAPKRLNRDRRERIGCLLAIHKSLRTLFPHNRELAYGWITTRNKTFENLQPVEAIQEWGFSGLLMVRAYLDRAVGETDMTGSNDREKKP